VKDCGNCSQMTPSCKSPITGSNFFFFAQQQLKMSTTKHKALVTFEKNEHALACRRKFHR